MMDEKELGFFIFERQECPECHGDGFVRHMLWVDIQAAWEKETGQEKRIPWNTFVKFAEDYVAAENKFHKYTGPADLPDEEAPCDVCQGDGYIQMETPLVDALVKLKVISPAHEEHLEALGIK